MIRGNSRGFTLMELIITMFIIVIIAIFSYVNLIGRRNSADLTSTSSQIASVLQDAESRSSSQDNNTVWGVHFDNVGSIPSYSIFSGASYATTSVESQYRLPADICYANLSKGSSTDIVFQAISGYAMNGTSTVIRLAGNIDCPLVNSSSTYGNNLVMSSTVTVSSFGVITHS